ncbi:MAG: SIS domain-containing protein [Clostridia bacterium]|nr:SIS domain-containing protein [Clostridia bacterium]
MLRLESYLEKFALAAKDADAVFFLGRKGDYAAAREGSLKLKEVSYLFSEAYPSGELKHGTLALMEKGIYGVIVATDPLLLDKNAATVSEITCRGAVAIVIASSSFSTELPADYVVAIPDASPLVSPVLSAVVMQYLAYFVAKQRGCDVDRPRNLAKSVTVE